MNSNKLLECAFLRGTGISRASALQSYRYQQLMQRKQAGSFTDAEQVAELYLLGEGLADQAFFALPEHLQLLAKKWQRYTALEQEHAMNDLVQYFTSRSWQEARQDLREQSFDDDVRVVLPAEYQSWEKGQVMPNCLGLTQMLIGFARKTGSRYLLVDTLQRYDASWHYDMYMGHMLFVEVLNRHRYFSNLRVVQRSVADFCKKVATHIADFMQNDQAHHALLLEGKDGVWHFVDAYMNLACSISDKGENVYSRLFDGLHDEAKEYYHYGVEHTNQFNAYAQDLDHFLNVFEIIVSNEYGESGFDEMAQALLTLVAACVHEGEGHKYKIAQVSGIVQLDQFMPRTEEEIRAEVLLTIVRPFVTKEDYERFERAPALLDGAICDILEGIKSKDGRRRFINRLAYTLAAETVELAGDIYNPGKIHPLLEISRAEYHLAVMTLNHMAGVSGVSNADMLTYDPFSQYVIRATLPSIERSDASGSGVVQEFALANLASLSSEHVMIDLKYILGEV